MTVRKTVKFVKTHALGNDFLVVDRKELPAPEAWPVVAQAMCHRRRGIGADGLVVFETGGGGTFSMVLLNQDGSHAEISGNGLRCLGAYLRLSSLAKDDKIVVETGSGTRTLEFIEATGSRVVFKAAMGAPRLASEEIPFQIDPPREPVVGVPLEVAGRTLEITAVSMGNPHCVVFVDSLDRDVLLELGPLIESHVRFPRKTNAELVSIRSRSEIAMRIWERGAGETEASGTGSAAAAVASMLNGKTDDRVTVECPGGKLDVHWENRQEVYVTGEAVVVAEGTFEIED